MNTESKKQYGTPTAEVTLFGRDAMGESQESHGRLPEDIFDDD